MCMTSPWELYRKLMKRYLIWLITVERVQQRVLRLIGIVLERYSDWI